MTDTSPPRPPRGGSTISVPPLSDFIPKRSVGLKLLLVCGLALLMSIPAFFVFLVSLDRQTGMNQAISAVSESVGGEQSVLGPVLVLPYARAPDPKRPDRVVYGTAIAYAETGTSTGTITVEERQRGIHPVPVFDADLTFEAVFDPGALRSAVPKDADPIWADARLYMGVSDTRGIKDAIDVVVNSRAIQMEPTPRTYTDNGAYNPVPASALTLAGGQVPTLETATGPLSVSATMRLTGAQRFSMGPWAKDTRLTVTSNWEDPSFNGGTLPTNHTASDEGVDGFTANWRVPYLARGIPGAGANLELSQVNAWNQREMGTRFMRGVNPYQGVERALKYAVMFVGFVFLAYFLFEVTSNARAHPAQYVLVGLAQTIFYVLLLAFSERIGFDLAFLIAASMTVTLTAAYAMSVFKSRTYGVRALAVLSGIYGLIYVLMRAEGHALLAGALTSFAAIALTMYLTRDIDWYGGRDTPAK